MENKTIISEALIASVKSTFKAYFSGNLNPWFEQLSNRSTYLGSGEPMLIGKNAIINHFKKYTGMQANIVDEDYHAIMQGKTLGIIYGKVVIAAPDSIQSTTIQFTIIYKIRKSGFEIIHQHNSYEHKNSTVVNGSSSIITDDITLQFIRNLLMYKDENKRLAIPSGTKTFYVNSNMIFYIQSVCKKTEFVCADRIISCNSSISELKSILPDLFYPIHRSYIVNIRHISQIKRFEATMINGAVIPIPALTYTQVKKDLEKYMD